MTKEKFQSEKTLEEIIKFLCLFVEDGAELPHRSYILEKYKADYIHLDNKNELKVKKYFRFWAQ